MRRIRNLLPGAMESPEVLRAGRALAIFKRWPEVVGESLAQRSWPDRYADGTVWVAVEGAAWASELRLQKEQILARMRQIANEDSLFRDIRFGQRPLPERATPVELPTPEAVEPAKEDEEGPLDRSTPLTIQEIAARRLAKRKKD